MWFGGKTFPEQRFRWQNRWIMPNPVRTSTKIGITGKTIIFAQAQVGGRDIILDGWLTPAEFQDLQVLYGQAGQDFALLFDSGEQFQNVVIMSIDSSAVLDKTNPNWIKVTAKLMTIAA